MKDLKVTANSKIYIQSYANPIVTGGLELLQQICYQLRILGHDSYLYFEKECMNPINERFQKYNNPFVFDIEDIKENILIIPEVNVKLPYKYNYIQKVFWWMSVDNYKSAYLEHKKSFWENIKNIIKKRPVVRCYNINSIFRKRMTHMYQSQYAKSYLISKRIPINGIRRLSDYLSDAYLEAQTNELLSEREDIILYNPKKGFEFTKKILKYCEGFVFVPIQNMTNDEILKLMLKSKVYIDFGTHPGKDRIPREAAICGCCIVTNKKGSAAFYEDIPIPEEFKIVDIDENLEVIKKTLSTLLENFENESKKYETYRIMIRAEKNMFADDLRSIFGEVKNV